MCRSIHHEIMDLKHEITVWYINPGVPELRANQAWALWFMISLGDLEKAIFCHMSWVQYQFYFTPFKARDCPRHVCRVNYWWSQILEWSWPIGVTKWNHTMAWPWSSEQVIQCSSPSSWAPVVCARRLISQQGFGAVGRGCTLLGEDCML